MRLGNVITVNPESIRSGYPFDEIEYIDISSVGTDTLQCTQRLQIGGAPSRAKRIVRNGDTLLATVRPNLRSFWFARNPQENAIASTGFAVLRARKEIDARFLYFTVTNQPFTDYLTANAKGAAYPAVDTDTIERAEIFLPPLPTQRKIATILSAYDDLIDNNLRRIKILEEMVQNLYCEWFVKFRFPGHQHVCLTDSPVGRIPEGWEVASISDVAIIYRGRSYKGTELTGEGGRPFVNLKCIERDGGFRSSGLKRYTGPFKDMHTVRAGEMVMAITDMTQERRIVARVGRVSRLDADFGVISMDLVRVASRGNLSETYLYAMLRWSGFADEVKQHANGVNVLHLLPDRIEEYRFVCPTSDIAARFGEVALPMLSLCDSLEQKNATLRRSRDLLLPRLISGEVDVSALDIAVPDEAGI